MKTQLFFIVVIAMLPNFLFSQAIAFQKSYDFSFDDKFYDFVTTSDGGFILVGTTMVSPYVSNLLIVKTDGNGELEWSKVYGADSICTGNRIIQSSNNNYIIAGSYGVPNQAYLLKIDSQGDSLTSYFFPSEYGSTCIDVVELDNTNLLLIQEIFLLPASSDIIYSDATGNIIWAISAAANESKTIHLISDTEFYVAGFNGIVNYTHNIFTKYNILGTIELNKEYSSFNGVNLCSALNNEGVYMAGSREYNSGYYANVMKADINGQFLWENAYFDSGFSFITSIATIDSDYIVFSGVHDDKIFIFRINSEGDSINSVIFNENDKQRAEAMLYMDDFLYVAGNKFNWGEGGDAYFLKLHLDTLSTGINEPKRDIISQLTIFPNPTDEYIDIKIPKELQGQTFDLMIHNNLGDKVYQKKHTGDIAIDISYIEPGIYFLSMVSQTKTIFSKKLIKK